MSEILSSGLYVVATPIGHLGDITRRAVTTLEQASFVVAEDTRRSRQLLSHLGIGGKPVLCIDAHAGAQELRKVVDRIAAGESCAMVTDAGMPSVSDPGSNLVSACYARELPVTVIPGPSAVTAALAASGLADAGFWFVGFLPRKGEKRQAQLQAIADCADAVVLFEAPQRMSETLRDLAEVAPERALCVARELTKQFEEVRIHSARDWAEREHSESPPWRGEVTMVLGPRPTEAAEQESRQEHWPELDVLIGARLARGESPKSIAEGLVPWLKLPRRVIYQRAIELSQRS